MVAEKRMQSRPEPLFKQHLWQEGSSPVAGVDEVGVGVWAGPVIAAAVILPHDISLTGLNDSKLLSAKRRAALFDAIRECALAIGVGLPTARQEAHGTSSLIAASTE